jgi:hypothetical protein
MNGILQCLLMQNIGCTGEFVLGVYRSGEQQTGEEREGSCVFHHPGSFVG